MLQSSFVIRGPNNSMNIISKNLAAYLIFFLLIFGAYSAADAYVASSTNYRIQSDSINVGGILSTSTNYRIEDTAGEAGTGLATGTTYKLFGGYQEMHEIYISISSPSDVSMSPSITGGDRTSNGSVSWLVTTDSESGYTFAIKAGSAPALSSSASSFSDYSPQSGNPDFTWSVTGNNSEFGFTPSGSHITSTYKDDGSSCGGGSQDTSSACWDGFSTSNKTIASLSSGNHPNGTATTISLRAEIGPASSQPVGSYSASITATALSQ